MVTSRELPPVLDPRPEPEAGSWDDFLSELRVEQVGIAKVNLQAHRSVQLGGHDQDAFLYILEGAAGLHVNELEYQGACGRLFHLRPGQSCLVQAGSEGPCTVVELRFTASIMDEVGLSELVEFPTVVDSGINSVVGQYILAAIDVMQMVAIGRQQCLRSLATLAVISLVRDHVPDAKAMLKRTEVMQIRRLLPAIRLLRTDVGSVQTVESLARACHLSVAQFRRLFCAKFSTSPMRYIQRMRVQEACRLLNYSDHTVSEICVRIGYEQASHFHKTFKRIVGRTPRAYREELLACRAG